MKQIADELASVVAEAAVSLSRVSEEEAGQPVLEGGWSRKQVLGHLIDSASNNHQRFVRAALEGSVDLPGYDQDAWVRIGAAQEAEWSLLLDAWSAMNRLLAHLLGHLPPEAARAFCRIGGNPAVRVEKLAREYVLHLRHHLAQIAREV